MAKVLTVKAIENLKPTSRRREVPDGEVRGLYLQIFPSGKASWCFRYRFARRTRKWTIGLGPEIGLKDARDLARKAHLTVAGGMDPAAQKKTSKATAGAPADRDLVEKVAAQFLIRHMKPLAPTTRAAVERFVNKEIVPAFRGRRLSEIKRSDVADWLDTFTERGAPIAGNRALACFKTLCNFAVQRGIIEISPIAGIKPPSAEKARDRVLSDFETARLWEAADALEQPHSGFIKLLVLTGQRRNEVARLPWREVDLATKLWTLPASRAKNGIEHTIPLSDLAIEILKSIPRIEGPDFVSQFPAAAQFMDFTSSSADSTHSCRPISRHGSCMTSAAPWRAAWHALALICR